ncbi:cell cycle progression protein 1 [Xenopus laevis]|uniref:Cell cycle progression protein 1 n=1 Tax=Xenopus laevis TaxID=8355 RepID=A0A8J0UWT2_XENLA|nr:cell cycle progression protein 1 [Xenopus laevis]XP_018110939.1 cell cycle progression protein 1 [Xenopus laevis]XP_018110940.1 cell cycle progression protein 1 [Xenopus laevis]XP_018110941.1 cell cycle progression protein 1 [Xenopus laevis]
MSENSSDSESSCGWTIINHEGSDVETLHPQNGEPYYDLASVLQSHIGKMTSVLASEQAAGCVQEQQYEELGEQSGTNEGAISCVESQLLAKEKTQPAPEVSLFHGVSAELENVPPNELRCQEKGSPLADGQCEAASDDSDIVALEVEAVGELEKGTSVEEQVEDTGDVNMSSSFSSQYTFGHADTVFPAQQSVDESSNDEASDDSGPSLRRRRSKRPTSSVCEPENSPPIYQLAAPKPKALFQLGSLNKCIILFLVIATSMGFGHFYGTIQILEQQKMAENIHEDELNDMKDDMFQCQKDQETTMEQNFEADDLSTSLKTTEVEKKNLVVENQHLQESLEKEEKTLSSLQEELRKLREQIRNLEEKGRGEIMLFENQKLKAHLIEERQKVRSFRTQKENLLTEAKILRTELDNERQITEALKAQLEEMSNREAPESENSKNENQDIQHLRERLYDLENKLNFEQQRSDLWERLYIEAKEQNEKLETESIHNSKEKEQSKNSKARDKSKKKLKDTFFSSVKDTFDAMKNSTKEFVRHHKEKIKQAKEAVKENLKKFSDSVKTTFRHFKDSTKNMFDKNHYKKYTERRREEAKEANTVKREYNSETQEYGPKKETVTQKDYKRAQDAPSTKDQNTQKSDTVGKESSDQYSTMKGCSGVFECAHQESTSLFNKVLNPVRVEEFNHLMQIYVQGQVTNFQHWKELQQFINRFFHNGVFIHDQMLFTDFVNDVEDYLEDMEEYQTKNGGVFEDLDEFVYRHYFGNNYPNSFGPRKPETNSLQKDPEAQRYQKQEQKNNQYRYRRDGKWQKHGRSNGRHMANVEIELGQLPFDPKY